MGLPRFPHRYEESVLAEDGQLFYCDSCEVDVTYKYRVRCAECSDYDLCVNCFLSGKETKQHRSDHSYIPVSRNEQRVFPDSWTADEELLLLDTVAKVGLGNWPEVAECLAVVGSKPPKNKLECEEHFYRYHATSTGAATVVAHPRWPVNPSRLSFEDARRRAHEQLVGRYLPAPRPPYYSPPPGFHCTVAGFMPLRNDFEHEWENDYELQLADVELRGDETPQEKELKLMIVLVYCSILDGRYERKRMVIERGYTDMKRLANYEGAMSSGPGHRQLLQLFRTLGRYEYPTTVSTDSYVHHPALQKLARLLLEEHLLLERMDIIREWKALGLLYWDEVVNYESFRAAGVRPPPITSDSHIDNSFGSNCLMPQEAQLCQKAQIPPLQYLVTKAITLKVLASSSGDVNGGMLPTITPPPSSSSSSGNYMFDAIVTAQQRLNGGEQEFKSKSYYHGEAAGRQPAAGFEPPAPP